jgi:hypothetical protein
MVNLNRLIPFGSGNSDKDEEFPKLMTKVHTIKSIREGLISLGLQDFPPEKLALDGDENIRATLVGSEVLGLAAILQDMECDSTFLKWMLGHYFIYRGWEEQDFDPLLDKAMELIGRFCSTEPTDE